MTTPKLWLVNPFDPVPGATHSRPMRYEGFARALADGGWDVTWLTADFDHLTRRYRVPPDVDRVSVGPRLRVEYVHVPPYRATFGAARIRSHRSYTSGLRARMHALGAERPAVILASLPLLGSLRACLAYGRRAGCAVVTDIQDTWPEALGSLLPKPLRRSYRPLRAGLVRAEQREVRTCDGVIAVSETYLRERYAPDVPALCAYLGVDLEAFDAEMRIAGLDPAARPAPGRGPVTFLWTGTIRPSADLSTVIRAAALVRARGVPARFVIAGDGPRRPVLEALARALDLGPETVVFRGAYPDADRARLVFESHVGLNAYVADAVNTTTNKLFDYQAASLTIVNSLPGEIGRLIADHGMGRNYLAGDAESLAAAIATLVREPARIAAMGRAARRFAEAHGSRAVIARRVVAFLEDVGRRRGAIQAS
jgi:glycosyltransferase involved in cell wall biosynthesis